MATTKKAAKKTPAKRASKPPVVTWQLVSPVEWVGRSAIGDVYRVSRRQTGNGVTWVTDVQLTDEGPHTFEEAQQVAEKDAQAS